MIQNILKINYYDNYKDSLLNQEKFESCLIVDNSPNFIFVLPISPYTIQNIKLHNLSKDLEEGTYTTFSSLTYKSNDIFYSVGYGNNVLSEGNIYQYRVNHNNFTYYSNPFKKRCILNANTSKILYSGCCQFDEIPYSLMQSNLNDFEIVFEDDQYKASFEIDKEYVNRELSNETINITMRKFFKINRGLLTENVVDALKSCAFFENKKFILKGKEYDIKDIDVKEVVEPKTKGLFSAEIDIYTKSIINDENCCDISLCRDFKYVFKLNPNEVSREPFININIVPSTAGTHYVLYTKDTFLPSGFNLSIGLYKLIITGSIGNFVYNYQIIPITSNDFIKVTNSISGNNPITYYKRIDDEFIQYNFVITNTLNPLFGLVYCFDDCYISVIDTSDNSTRDLVPDNGIVNLIDYFESGTYNIRLNMKNKSCDYGTTTPFQIIFN